MIEDRVCTVKDPSCCIDFTFFYYYDCPFDFNYMSPIVIIHALRHHARSANAITGHLEFRPTGYFVRFTTTAPLAMLL